MPGPATSTRDSSGEYRRRNGVLSSRTLIPVGQALAIIAAVVSAAWLAVTYAAAAVEDRLASVERKIDQHRLNGHPERVQAFIDRHAQIPHLDAWSAKDQAAHERSVDVRLQAEDKRAQERHIEVNRRLARIEAEQQEIQALLRELLAGFKRRTSRSLEVP